jgi:UDP-N-acetylmuramate dehydrogenase
MLVEENISIKKYNTFGLDYRARLIVHPETDEDLKSISSNFQKYEPYIILGGGSNLLFTGDFNGTLIHPVLSDIKMEGSDSESVLVSAGAGLNWDQFVEWCVNNDFYGIENLSLIPGNVGASPVQNIGAYGTEIRETVERVEAIRLSDCMPVAFSNIECGFDYRFSIFKGELKGKHLVTRVFFRLNRKSGFRLDYGTLKEEVGRLGGENIRNVRQAVINIRMSKLPDPAITGNAGSFFKNPVVQDVFAERLKVEYPALPVYPAGRGFNKIPAGWLIEQCGWKGRRIGDAGVHDRQALVIVNYGNATGMEIYNLSESVRSSVKQKFGLDLEREVEVLGSI